ncbi:MAG: acetyl-CoA carboxylase carboxyltransferase subunit beta [Bryobacterales bacterium]|nr:acetyl-CoA carboxylase carboxyltransferase subunit beta [Bryobacterales bacterium]
MSWFTRKQPSLTPDSEEGERKVKTEGLWLKCEGCSQVIWRKGLEENLWLCDKCGYHFKVDAVTRLKQLFDDGDFTEHDSTLVSTDPLGFTDSKPYGRRLTENRSSTGLPDAVLCATGRIHGRPVEACAMELKFVGGSMGAVVGEKITRAIERAIASRSPVVIVSASGGARMQEGAISLMQMAKISAALMRLDEAKLPYISILTDPTTGGVTASYAMLGDLNIAEPGALIGFAGPRVIEQTIRQKLPAGFQRSEFLLQHGFLDAVVKRPDLRQYLAHSFDFFCGKHA